MMNSYTTKKVGEMIRVKCLLQNMQPYTKVMVNLIIYADEGLRVKKALVLYCNFNSYKHRDLCSYSVVVVQLAFKIFKKYFQIKLQRTVS